MDGVEVEGTAARVISCWRSLMSAGSEGLLMSGRLMSGVSGGVLTGVIVLKGRLGFLRCLEQMMVLVQMMDEVKEYACHT